MEKTGGWKSRWTVPLISTKFKIQFTKTKEIFCTLRSKSWNLQHAANPDFILHFCTSTICTCTNKKKPEPEPKLHLRLRWLRTWLFFSNPLQLIHRFDLENYDRHDTDECFKLKLEQHGRKLPVLRPRQRLLNDGRILTSIGANKIKKTKNIFLFC